MSGIRFTTLLFIFFAACCIPARAQVLNHVPGKERGDGTFKRRTEIDGNNVRTSVFNYLFSGRLGVG
ncbi:MAG: hypothetical protein AB1428_13675, partial [Bacteroidota bacterium]